MTAAGMVRPACAANEPGYFVPTEVCILVTAFVPSDTACLVSSPGSTRRAAACTSRDESARRWADAQSARASRVMRPSASTTKSSMTRAAAGENDDPALAPFLGFLVRDLAEHPERLQAVDAGLAQRIQALVGDVEVDLDAPLSADDE